MTDAVENPPLGATEHNRHFRWQHYLGAAIVGIVTAFACFGGMFVLLAETGHLPPPAISNNLCIDEKLAFMRDNPPRDANFLVVGSSVAWRHIDSSILASSLPGTTPYNGAFCGLTIAETVPVTQWLLDRLPAVRHLLLVASPQDFESCSGRPPATHFNIAEADLFVFQRAWRWGYYFRYFDPVSFVRNAISIAQLRTKKNAFESLIMTKYGDAPLDPPRRDRLVYDRVDRLDPICFGALRALALEMRGMGIALTVVSTPLNPLWEHKYDPGARTRKALDSGIDAALADSGAQYWNGNVAFSEGPEAFTDAIHLRWSAAQSFTKRLVEESLTKPASYAPPK